MCHQKHKQSSLRQQQIVRLNAHLDWSVHVRLFNAQDNLPGNSDSVEQVVDEAHVVDERVHVAGAEHEQRGQALRRNGGGATTVSNRKSGSPAGLGWKLLWRRRFSLTVKSKAGMGVQRLMWIMARRLGRWPSLAPAKNNLREMTS